MQVSISASSTIQSEVDYKLFFVKPGVKIVHFADLPADSAYKLLVTSKRNVSFTINSI